MDDEDDEDSDLLDFSALKVSAEEALLFVDHANGAIYHSFIDTLIVRVTGSILNPGPFNTEFACSACVCVGSFKQDSPVSS